MYKTLGRLGYSQRTMGEQERAAQKDYCCFQHEELGRAYVIAPAQSIEGTRLIIGWSQESGRYKHREKPLVERAILNLRGRKRHLESTLRGISQREKNKVKNEPNAQEKYLTKIWAKVEMSLRKQESSKNGS